MKPENRTDDVSSAPESGTIRDDTSGNQPSDRTNDRGPTGKGDGKHGYEKALVGDDVTVAGEEALSILAIFTRL